MNSDFLCKCLGNGTDTVANISVPELPSSVSVRIIDKQTSQLDVKMPEKDGNVQLIDSSFLLNPFPQVKSSGC